jgi:hypothetical protein
MAKRMSPFVKGLIDKYKQAALDERSLTEAFDNARKALLSSKETKQLCAALLVKEGYDPDTIELGIDPAVARAFNESVKSQAAPNGDEPRSATHAVYLTMKKRDNPGFTFAELLRLSREDGTPLTSRDLNKVIWTQTKKERMERLEDGRIRLTAKGEEFTNFRRKVSDEEEQHSLMTAS